MQLQFTLEELKFVAEILAEQSAALEGPLKAASSALLGHIAEHDLRLAFHELEDLRDILIAYAKSAKQNMLQVPPELQPVLLRRKQLFEQIMDKVTEACAMV